MKYAVPKKADVISLHAEWDGVKCSISLNPQQKWKLTNTHGYKYLTRKGMPITLRLTPRGFDKLFIEAEEGK